MQAAHTILAVGSTISSSFGLGHLAHGSRMVRAWLAHGSHGTIGGTRCTTSHRFCFIVPCRSLRAWQAHSFLSVGGMLAHGWRIVRPSKNRVCGNRLPLATIFGLFRPRVQRCVASDEDICSCRTIKHKQHHINNTNEIFGFSMGAAQPR